jgi:hypothetical protein
LLLGARELGWLERFERRNEFLVRERPPPTTQHDDVPDLGVPAEHALDYHLHGPERKQLVVLVQQRVVWMQLQRFACLQLYAT